MLVALWIQWSRIQDPFIIQDDFRKFHWMLRLEDPELFLDDPLTSQSIMDLRIGPVRMFVDPTRPGYSLLFYLASPLFSPTLFNKLLIFPLLLLSVYFLFRIGEIAEDPGTGFTLALSFIILTSLWTSSTSVAAGLPRSFMAPAILGIVFFLMRDRYWMATGVVFMTATIYLPATALGIMTIAFAALEPTTSRWRYRINWRRILPLVVFSGLLLLVLPTVFVRVQDIWAGLLGQNWSFGAILRDPTYSVGGRLPLFSDFPFQGHGALVNQFMNLWLLLVLTPLSGAILLLRPGAYEHFPRILKLLFIASLLLYFLAWLAIFLTSSLALYFPSRYTRFSLVLVLLIFVVMNLGPAIRISWTRLQKLDRSSRVLTIAATLVTAVIMFLLVENYALWNRLGAISNSFKIILLLAYAFLIGSIFLISRSGRSHSASGWATERLAGRKEFSILFSITLAALVLIGMSPNDHHFITIESPERDMLAFLQTTPKDSLTAGDPCSLDNVPLVAKRQIFFSCEFLPSGAEDKVLDNFRAYYADSLSEVREFCETYGVDYFTVVTGTFDNSEATEIFFEPYHSVLNNEITSQAEYVLEDIPDKMRLYETEDLIVMQCIPDNFGELASQTTQIEGLGILAHDEISGTLAQAGEVEVTIKWVAEKEMPADFEVCFSVIDNSGQIRQRSCEPLSPHLPTSQWQIPEIRYETYKLRISPYLESGDYSIVASVSLGEEPDSNVGIVIGEIAYSALPRTFSSEDIDPESVHAIWGDVIALTDFEVTESDSNILDLVVRWQALARMPESYKMFAQLRRAGTNEIESQIDTIPKDWTYPTDWWEANEIITDTLSIPLKSVSPGQFELWLGFYIEESGERLPLVDPLNMVLSAKENAVKIYEYD